MKKFLIKITAYGYITEFTVMAQDSSEAIENAILDKLGKNDINWEKSGFYSLTKKWLTFDIKTKEAELAHHVSKVEDSAPQVSVAT